MKDKKNNFNNLETPQMSLSENLINLLNQMKLESGLKTIRPLKTLGEEHHRGFYLPPPTPTIIEKQAALEQSGQFLTNHLKIQRQILANPFPPIIFSEEVPKKTIYLRPLRRKSSRRWQKKWAKRGWKIQIDQILMVDGQLMMNQSMHNRLCRKIQEDMNKILNSMHEGFINEFFGGKR